ncbi:MAG: IS30 family transposase, partial [Alphaproteobacteria bacterium]
AEKLWRYLTRRKASRGRRARRSRDKIAGITHISQRPEAANTRDQAGRWEGDLLICKPGRPLLVLHERKTRLTVMTRLASKTAAETMTAITDILARLDPRMRRSVTFDNGSEFARHSLPKDVLKMATCFCDACASWQKGGIENANGRIRRWLTRQADLDDLGDEDIQDLAMTMNLTPRKCLGFRSPAEAFLNELGKPLTIRFNPPAALRS